MSPLPRLCLVLALAGLVQACQVSLPGSKAGPDGDVTPGAVAGDPIEVTALDEPAPAAAPDEAPTVAVAQDSPPDGAPEAPAVPAPQPEVAAEKPAEVVPPAPPKTEAQLACERRKGTWTAIGGTLRACVFQTRDGGKRCDRESDCEGACLARSGTCSPLQPLFGCHEILQDNGARVTQCIE